MANSSLFAIKREGKTLGVKDIDQLRRLVSLSEITDRDMVYVIAEKRWCPANELPGWNSPTPETATADAVEQKVQAVQKVAAAFEEDEMLVGRTGPTREFAQLFDQFEKELPKKQEPAAEEDYIAFQPKTIRRVKGISVAERSPRHTNVMDALRDGQKPPVLSSVSLRVAILVFVLFLAALAYGLFTSKLLDFGSDNDPRANYLDYQAKTEHNIDNTQNN